MILSLVEKERLFLVGHGDIGDTTDENRMVPGLMHGKGLAFENSEAFLEHRATILPTNMINPLKPVIAGHGEPVGETALIGSENIYGELSAGEKLLTVPTNMSQAEKDEWRIKGDGAEGIDRHTERFPRRTS